MSAVNVCHESGKEKQSAEHIGPSDQTGDGLAVDRMSRKEQRADPYRGLPIVSTLESSSGQCGHQQRYQGMKQQIGQVVPKCSFP